MLVIAVIVIVTFVVFYDPAKLNKIDSNSVGEIYGHNLTQTDIDREVKNFQLALPLGEYGLIGDLGGMAQNEAQALNEFVFNMMVLRHQAKALGIEPTDAQIADHIKALPALQTSGQFDPRKYASFVETRLGPAGMTERSLEDIARDAIRLEQLKSIVGAPLTATPGEVSEAMRTLQKMDLQKVKFPLPDVAAVAVTPEEINSFYELNKATLLMPETRVVEYVEFTPPAGDDKLEGKAKIDAQQKLANEAANIAEQLTATNFAEVAGKAGLTVKTSPEFTNSGATQVPGDLVDDLKTIAPNAFLLTENSPVSDVLQSGDKFFIVKLTKVNSKRQLAKEEVAAMIEGRLRATKANELLESSAAKALATIRAELAAGKSFTDAATAAGVTAEALNGFSINSDSLSMDQRELASVALLLEPGQISNFVPTADGGFAVLLVSRAAVDAADTAQKEEIEEGITESKRRLLFISWLASEREKAGLAIASRERQQ